MPTVYLPIAAGPDDAIGTQARPRIGYALYGVAHARHHDLLRAGWPMQNWVTRACCMVHPTYYPSLTLRYWTPIDQFRQLCAQYPGRDWLGPNEPNVWSQSVLKPIDYAGPVREWVPTIRASGGRFLGPNIAIQPPQEQAVWYPWRQWLDEYLALPNAVLPDAWAIHNYSATAAEWQQQYEDFQAWNETSGGRLPVVYTETGWTPEVWQHVCALRDSRIETILWFTDKPEEWIPPNST